MITMTWMVLMNSADIDNDNDGIIDNVKAVLMWILMAMEYPTI